MVAPGTIPGFPPPVFGIMYGSCKDLAELVGASRPRVTEYLALFEREHLIARDGRQLIVRRDRLESFLAQKHASASRRTYDDTLAS
jgi:DNA-binding IclR family transcriptional regulator